MDARVAFGRTVCPHDCPSTCALEVELLDDQRIGRVRGAKDNSYTAGVVCAKVGRYAERLHHPDRLLHPLKRTGPKGSGQFTRIGWDEALDTIAAAFNAAERRVRRRQRLAILLRRHHGARDARRHRAAAPRQEILAAELDHLLDAVLYRFPRRHRAADGARPARDGVLGCHRHLGHQSGQHPSQRDDPRDARPQGSRRQDRRRRRLQERHRRAGRHGVDPEARHRCGARLCGHARAVSRWSCRLAVPRKVHRPSEGVRAASQDPHARVGERHHRAVGR